LVPEVPEVPEVGFPASKVVVAERVIFPAVVVQPVLKISVTGAAETWNQREVVGQVTSSPVQPSMQ